MLRPIKIIQYIFFGLLVGFLSVGMKAQAASIIFQSDKEAYGLESEIAVDVMLDPQGESVNAVEGKILFDADRLEYKGAEDNLSIISYWLERPTLLEGGVVELGGLIPGGFEGVLSPYYEGAHPGKVITLLFRTKKSGQSSVKIADMILLKNDGKGSPISFTTNPIVFSVSSTTGSFIFSKMPDQKGPEEFTPEISNSVLLFDGKWFVVFKAEDIGSGINHYEIEESSKPVPQGNWEIAESPYVLKDQKLGSYIFIKAVDNAKNEKIETIAPAHPLANTSSLVLKILLLLVVILSLWRLAIFYNGKKNA